MIYVYTAPITDPTHRTLQASGKAWTEIVALLQQQRQAEPYLDAVMRELPVEFRMDEMVRITVQKRVATRVLSTAGVSS